jgi:hypothetical protein
MCMIPKMIMMRPTVIANPVQMKRGTMIVVMECPEYQVTVSLHSDEDMVFGQVWQCKDVPGWFRTWEQLRCRMHGCYERAMCPGTGQ